MSLNIDYFLFKDLYKIKAWILDKGILRIMKRLLKSDFRVWISEIQRIKIKLFNLIDHNLEIQWLKLWFEDQVSLS